MNKKKVLLFSIERNKAAAIEALCAGLGWQAEEIPRNRYGEPLGALVGLPPVGLFVGKAGTGGEDGAGGAGGAGTADRMDSSDGGDKAGAKPGIYAAIGFPVEMLVLCGLEEGDLDRFLKAYRKAEIAPVPLKAVLTPYNVSWTAEKLFGELMAEHTRMMR